MIKPLSFLAILLLTLPGYSQGVLVPTFDDLPEVYDDSDLRDKLETLNERVTAIETALNELSNNVPSPPGKEPTEPIDPPEPPVDPIEGDHNAYFERLDNHPGRILSYSMRDQSQLDGMPTARRNDPRWPDVVYDPAMDAMLQQLHPAEFHVTGPQQKRPWLRISNVPSMLLTWEFRYDEGLMYKNKPPSDVVIEDGKRKRDYGDLIQHKSWNVYGVKSSGKDDVWLAVKANYAESPEDAVAEIFCANPGGFLVPGKSNNTDYGSERLAPRTGVYYAYPNRWNRVFVFVDGQIENGSEVLLSVWIADDAGQSVQLLYELPMRSPSEFSQLMINHDSSQNYATNGLSKIWQRNIVAIAGIDQVEANEIVGSVHWGEQ